MIVSNIRKLLNNRIPNLEMYFDGDSGYAEAIANWNFLVSCHPEGVVAPRSAEEISEILACVREAGVTQVAIRSGGHSFEGASLGGRDGNALVIDMKHLRAVTIDQEREVAIMQGGALIGDLIREGWNHGELMVPSGNCIGVGVGGQACAGGYGHFSRTYGIQADRVIRMELITADGTLQVADKDTNSDLFWALRGSGTGSFGIITKIEMKLNKAPKGIANFYIKYRIADIDFADTFSRLQDYCLSAPLSFNPMLVVWREHLQILGSIAAGTPEERDQLIADMKAKLPKATSWEVTPMNFADSMREHGLRDTSGPWYPDLNNIVRERDEHLRRMKIKAGFVAKPFTPEFIDGLAKLARTQASEGVRVQILGLDPNGGLPLGENSIRVRGCPWLMGMSSCIFLEEVGDVDTMVRIGKDRDEWMHRAYELFYPYLVGGYIGDDDLEEGDHGRDLYDSYFGENLPRLKEIKRKFDPQNIFHHKMSIPL